MRISALQTGLFRTALSGGVVLLGLVLIYAQLRTNRLAAETAAHDVDVCRRLAKQIEELRARPSRAALETRSETELARRIEEAAGSAQFPPENIMSIDPQPARRIEESAYIEQATSLELRAVSLKQLVQFLVLLVDNDSGLQVTDLRLSAPRSRAPQSTPQETWQAEVTLAYVIFSPIGA